MADITVEIDGVGDVITALQNMKRRVDGATFTATKASGDFLQQQARSNFQGTHARGEWHVGGQSPNTVSGNLQQSITAWPVVRLGYGSYSVQVNPRAVYTRVIELGATITGRPWLTWTGRRSDGSWGIIRKHQVTIKPHPYFTPAYHTTIGFMRDIFARAWGRAVNG